MRLEQGSVEAVAGAAEDVLLDFQESLNGQIKALGAKQAKCRPSIPEDTCHWHVLERDRTLLMAIRRDLADKLIAAGLGSRITEFAT